jgi:UDPglucose--hexose-1-phosphate uridylyltransferase
MPELRKDPIVDRWVIIATERGRRPNDFAGPPTACASAGGASCPLCEGSEPKTPPEVWSIRSDGSRPNTPGWQVRVVPNKFPALQIEGDVNRRGLGMFDMMDGVGAHEVIVESPDHCWQYGDGPPERIELALRAAQVRLTDLYRDARFRYCVIFRNYGPQAGASLDHPHSQIIAVPVTPKRVKEELSAAREYYAEKERCLFCDMIRQEQLLGHRVVVDRADYIALSPFAARFPFELAIYPKRHGHDFRGLSDPDRLALADVMHDCLRYIRTALGNPSYNFVISTCPNPVPRPGKPDWWGTLALDYHWHIEIMPRVTRIAGFEWGTDFYINPVAPELAAQFLREIILDENGPPRAEEAPPHGTV